MQEDKPKKEKSTDNTVKKRKKKDPDAPKKAPTAYLLYCNSVRKQVAQEHPELQFEDISRVLGEKYRNLTAEEKQPFIEEANRLKEQYTIAKQEYDDKTKVKIDLDLPPAQTSGLFLTPDVVPRVQEGLFHMKKAFELLAPVFGPAFPGLTDIKSDAPAAPSQPSKRKFEEETEKPQEPVKKAAPPSAFNLFRADIFGDVREQVIRTHGEFKMNEANKLVAQRWGALDPKEKEAYNAEHERQKNEMNM